MQPIPFEISHCSSFEEGYEPDYLADSSHQELDPNDTHRGWQTVKYPDYPQNLIVQLKNGPYLVTKIQILSHHYKIASQIEVYSGITKQQEKDSLYVEFTRLGFVTLDDNNRFQNRELKSIKIQADCEYISLVIKGCHDNRLNTHRQVGFLAISVLGHELTNTDHYIENDRVYISSPIQEEQNILSSFILQNWIKVIQNAEEEAAQDEDYKEAKIYKELGDRLLGLNKFLCNLEHEKQVAVAAKDYEEAYKIKEDMVQVMTTAESLLRQCGIQITDEGDILPAEPEIHLTTESENKNDAHQMLDEAIANWTSFDSLSIKDQSPASPACVPIPATNEKHTTTVKPVEDPEDTPEPLTEADLETCELPLSVFGTEMIACIMSVKVKCRTRGLSKLAQVIVETDELVKQENAHLDLDFIHASLLMLQEAIIDSRESIFNQTIDIWHRLQELCSNGLFDDANVFKWIERFFSAVLSRTADSNLHIKSEATQVILELIEIYHEGKKDLIPLCIKERMVRNVKEAKSRVDLVKAITEQLLLPTYDKAKIFYRLKDVVVFLESYFKNHSHSDIRQSAWKVLLLIAQKLSIKSLASYLNNDTIKALEKELKKNQNNDTVKELRALAVKSNATATSGTRKNQKKAGLTNGNNSKSTTKKTQAKKKKEEKKAPEEEEENHCIFCDEYNPEFNEDTLITHYYNHCPVLTNCPMCKTILEVSTLKEHLLLDCERGHLVKQCNHCKYPIPVEQWLQHTLKNTCTGT
ncbi:hypothetical protein G6F43_007531 [Rhizopus delemar]|nr:hypothetical protein G6F43_007531 [Rhizopus delemar]